VKTPTLASSTRLRQTIPVVILLVLFAQEAAAAPLKVDLNPGSFDAIKNTVEQTIPQDMQQAMCGGWDFDIKVSGVFQDPKGPQPTCAPANGQDIGSKCRDTDGIMWVKSGEDAWIQQNPPAGSAASASSSTSTPTRNNGEMDANTPKTDPDKGLIPKVQNLPGRDIDQVFWNAQSGLAKRKDDGPLLDIHTKQPAGFTFPENIDTCGFTTVCRPQSHPDKRTLPPDGQNHGPRDLPGFFCDHPCQRPLDGEPPIGKPKGWKKDDSSEINCGAQQPLDPETQVKYACGGLDEKGPDEGFCTELKIQGPKGGLCQDLNSWTYILWKRPVHVCLEKLPPITVMEGDPPVPTTKYPCKRVLIYRYEKGPCGFPEELNKLERNQELCKDRYTAEAVNECCSDDSYANPSVSTTEGLNSSGSLIITSCTINVSFDMQREGKSCKTCEGIQCRTFPEKDEVIVNDVWFEPFPTDVRSYDQGPTEQGCLVNLDQCSEGYVSGPNAPANLGAWPQPPSEAYRKKNENRDYISYFRDYNIASYERADLLKDHVKKDIVKMEKIPIACYGMYDYRFHRDTLPYDPSVPLDQMQQQMRVPEDARTTKVREEDKRCVIGAYYQNVNFATDDWDRKETQKGKAQYRMDTSPEKDDPFKEQDKNVRPYDEEKDMWNPTLSDSFSLLNEKGYEKMFGDIKDLTYALRSPDVAVQRATVQITKDLPMSTAALMRAFDDTVTWEKDPTRDRRTLTEWWQRAETQMHSAMTPPTVRMLIPATWSADLDALDPLFIAPVPSTKQEVDPRSETVEVQVRAREDLLGDVAAFLERTMLLRIQEEEIPVVVPSGTPTELRAIAQGWESWAKQQEKAGRNGAGDAREIRDQLLEYADRLDRVRILRAELPKYAATLLSEQEKIGKAIADWLKQNVDAYQATLNTNQQIEEARVLWQHVQGMYTEMSDGDGLPWCRNDRFTAPIYSLLDPWFPGREYGGDTTAGMKPFIPCMQNARLFDFCTDSGVGLQSCANQYAPGMYECLNAGNSPAQCGALIPQCSAASSAGYRMYLACLAFVGTQRDTYRESFDGRVCDQYLPPPPLLPFPEFQKDPDLLLDFTAFRELLDTVQLPVLKPVEIRIKLGNIEPPGLHQTEEPNPWPELPPLPDLPLSIANGVLANLPKINTDLRKPAAISGTSSAFPQIKKPTIDVAKITEFLDQAKVILEGMHKEYSLFWKSVYKKPCTGGGGGDDCVKVDSEQDCIEPYNDPKGKCVHFEGDLKERLQRIGARPGLFLKEDWDSQGEFRAPITHGQAYCEKEDWACQLLNRYGKWGREGWLLDKGKSKGTQPMIDTLRKDLREATQNASSSNKFIYDLPQKEMLENFKVVPVSPINDGLKPLTF